MKNTILILLTAILVHTGAISQPEKMTREDKNEKNAARQARVDSKNDFAIFKKQMLALKEFEAARQRIPVLRKMNKVAVKVTVAVDSTDDDGAGDSKTLAGYIRQDVGDNTTNLYEITFDRAQKKIVRVVRTEEAIEADREMMEEQNEQTTEKKETKHTAPKAKKRKDAENDEEE